LVAKLVCVREFESTSIHPNHVDARLWILVIMR
jgi:hypothetical protein